MATTTTNYNFIKPELTDAPPDITVLNENWDKIDTELKNKASLGSDGKVPSSQLPNIDVSDKVSKSGDTVSGPLIFTDQTAFTAISKQRTINLVQYNATYGCGQVGGKGCVAMELSSGGNIISRLEVRDGSVAYVDADNVRHTIVTGAVQATVES